MGAFVPPNVIHILLMSKSGRHSATRAAHGDQHTSGVIMMIRKVLVATALSAACVATASAQTATRSVVVNGVKIDAVVRVPSPGSSVTPDPGLTRDELLDAAAKAVPILPNDQLPQDKDDK